jgi:xanthine dehydrogenase YagT iron-sulfur-binding subunit
MPEQQRECHADGVRSCGCASAADQQEDGCIEKPSRGQIHDRGVSRRSFLQTLGVSAAASAVAARAEEALAAQNASGKDQVAAANVPVLGPEPIRITLNVNGQPMATLIDPATALMESLRWHLNLTGTKEVCDRGACGACSVLVDGKLVASCMMLAIDAVGSQVTTIEGLGTPENLDPVQQAFIKHDALQCGFCTPGLVVASRALLNQHPRPTMEQIKVGLSGNLCRCGTYMNVFNAVLEASGQDPIADAGGQA